MKRVFYSLPTLLILCIFINSKTIASPSVKVVTSIAPIHSLVTQVMKGISLPSLLLNKNVTPHSYSLKPSDAKLLQNADIVFWVGENLEFFLKKPLKVLSTNANIVALSQTKGLKLLPIRKIGLWHKENNKSTHSHSADELSYDPHIWLDPLLSIELLKPIVSALSKVDKKNTLKYEENAAILKSRLLDLNVRLNLKLKSIQNSPYMVFHDSYQYFENHYHLNSVGTLILNTEKSNSAKRMRKLHNTLKNKGVKCVFYEPQFSVKLVKMLTKNKQIKTAEIDPLGSHLKPGGDLYFKLMNSIADSLYRCLGGAEF